MGPSAGIGRNSRAARRSHLGVLGVLGVLAVQCIPQFGGPECRFVAPTLRAQLTVGANGEPMSGMTVSMDTLRDWLDQGRPVTVLDVRPSDQHAEWAIPGSVHVDAYDALKSNDPGALVGVRLPQDRPVVTVCGMGRTSAIAAQQLRDRGYEAFTLIGGMKAWSLAWNSAEVNLNSGSVRVIQLRRTGKGCLSYLIGSQDQAAVIDASVAPEVYLELASRAGWKITDVLDTHVHADHLSRSRQLSKLCGATLWLPEQRRVTYRFASCSRWGNHPGGRCTIGTASHSRAHTRKYVLSLGWQGSVYR